MYACVLANRIKSYMIKLLHHDQTGFVKTRLSSDNIHRLVDVIHVSTDVASPCAVLSLDAEKAFDRLEWDYCI